MGVHVLDLLVDGQIIVELKAVKAFEGIPLRAQVKSHLRATGLQVGLLHQLQCNGSRCEASCGE